MIQMQMIQNYQISHKKVLLLHCSVVMLHVKHKELQIHYVYMKQMLSNILLKMIDVLKYVMKVSTLLLPKKILRHLILKQETVQMMENVIKTIVIYRHVYIIQNKVLILIMMQYVTLDWKLLLLLKIIVLIIVMLLN